MKQPQKSNAAEASAIESSAAQEVCKEAYEKYGTNTASTCAVCSEGISNPICPECLEKQMQAFFGERVGKANTYVKKLTKIAMLHNDRASWCIKCGKEMGVCTHCFSSEVFDMVSQEYPELEHEFLLHFNYYLGG